MQIINKLKTFLTLEFIARLIIGILFIYASLHKIYDPASFAAIIYNYHIAPNWLISPAAIFLPWLELWVGLFLILGRFSKPSLVIMAGMLTIFILALSFNLWRGLDFECGCFTSTPTSSSINTTWNLLIRDLLMLGIVVYLFILESKKFVFFLNKK